ncbi:hypothetical protein PRIPAC_71811 [Pristionchus pacificus]|nr:hypothetical protein PRIPAC_71811 [Pristionchus pacificus]
MPGLSREIQVFRYVLSAARREWRPLFIKWTRHGVPWGLDLSAVLGPSFPNRMPRPHLEGGLGP